VANLWTYETEACQHTDEAERMALEQLERSRKDDEEAAAIMKERDELLERDVVTCQRILKLLYEIQRERD
jgi:phage terminase small subunit